MRARNASTSGTKTSPSRFANPPAPRSPAPRAALGTSALALLAGVAWLDFATGAHTSFTLAYLVPIAIATYFLGRVAGLAASVAAAGAGLAVAIHWETSLATEVWNSIGRLGVFLVFATLLDHVHRDESGLPVARQVYRVLGVCLASACVLAGLGWTVQREWPSAVGGMTAAGGARAEVRLSDLETQLESVLRESRPVLLGSRDPSGKSCVTPVKRGEIQDKVPPSTGDLNGGPGTTMSTLYTYDRASRNTAMLDFDWHQKRLRSYLENLSVLNQPVAEQAHALAEAARRFAERADGWTSVPADVATTGYARRDNWPSSCLAQLELAVRAKDLAGARRWADETAAACFALADLHRWLALLCENQIAALAFQKQCQGLFEWTDAHIEKYDRSQQISAFPGGVLSLNCWSNYVEVERQAERLFSMPADGVEELAHDRNLTAGSLQVLPAERACSVQLREALGRDNQATWDAAARAPYEHSYLVGMLYRIRTTGSTETMASVLRRFDAAHPRATIGDLMGVLMYRGHSFAGLEWADRLQPELMDAAGAIPATESDRAALLLACKWTNEHYGGPAAYGATLTLREALEQHKLDCVRATDMIGAIFRNAGRSRFGHVRWCAGTTAHSVAAYREIEGDASATLLVDGLAPTATPETWPAAYFKGHAWPAGMETNPTPYAVELYVRGLDNYLWAEGYVVRGPRAGWLSTARIPYAPWENEAGSRKVFDGPYPD